MSTLHRFLACDLGASSGRLLYGQFSGDALHFEEVHRFPTRHVIMLGMHQWDIANIYQEVIHGLTRFRQQFQERLDGIAFDTWGVDYGLLDRNGHLLGNPMHYRDIRTEGMREAACEIIPLDELYAMTGIGFNRFNTLFQLLAAVRSGSAQLQSAETLMMIGDLCHYLISGQKTCEYTNASTTQLLNPWTRDWHDGIIHRIGLDRRMFRTPSPAGTRLGPLLPSLADETGLCRDTLVISPATHDTASAVAATPVEDDGEAWCYISSGTWSIIGTELDAPLINEETFRLEFSNEGGAGGRICFQKTFIGLWLVQECRRAWERESGPLGYDRLNAEAEAAEPCLSLIDVDDPRLYAPDDMPQAIRDICQETGQPVPRTRGAITRCALESIALKYRQTLRELDQVLQRQTRRIHLMGGGARDRLLCQTTADACGVPVWAGPVEAAILGNFAMQALALGAVDSLASARRVIARSVTIQRFEPSLNTPLRLATAPALPGMELINR